MKHVYKSDPFAGAECIRPRIEHPTHTGTVSFRHDLVEVGLQIGSWSWKLRAVWILSPKFESGETK
jgi:hypothetical protein